MTLDKQYFLDKYPSDFNVPLPEVSVAIKVLLDEIEQLEAQKTKRCFWRPLDDDGGYDLWLSDCANKFIFDADGPVENGFICCPYCGRSLAIDK